MVKTRNRNMRSYDRHQTKRTNSNEEKSKKCQQL